MPKSISISNRRYLGNKYKLLNFIQEVVDNYCNDINVFADLFAGTGSVAFGFRDNKTIITNDILYSNYICNLAWFGTENFRQEVMEQMIDRYNAANPTHANYMSLHFADTYFSKSDCKKIGYIREDIERIYKAGNINARERAILISSLLYAMDRVAKTCGHYDAFIQDATFDEHLELGMLTILNGNAPNNQCFNEDINQLAKRIHADLVYLDPPYNSRQYCDAYHLLENVARWKKPRVYGVARKMDRSQLKSDYCTRSAASAFEDLVKNLDTRYILLSYNNMSTKGDDRSNARISDDDIMRILSAKGNVQVFSQDYKAFSAGKSDISDNQERLFLCTCR